MTEALAATGVFEAVVEYAELFASFAGEFLDLRGHVDHPALHPDKSIGYPQGNALADAARARGLNGIIYPSVRHETGICIEIGRESCRERVCKYVYISVSAVS